MIDSKKLLCEIDALNDEFVLFWEKFGNLESPTEYKEGVDKAGQLFIDYAHNLGFDVEVLKQEKSGNAVCITMNKDAKEKPISLAGHIDTVHEVGSFGSPATKIEGDAIYGPGVMDCKGGLVAALMAMTALKNMGFDKRPIKLLLDPDEEVNSNISEKQTIDFICERAKGSVAVLNCESARGNTAVLYRKGVYRYKLEITGKSIHASRCAEGGASAILEASHKIVELEKMKDNEGLTCNCGLISGGTSANTVPDTCSFTAEIRFKNAAELEKGNKAVKEVAEKSFVEGTTCNVTVIATRPAMEETDRNYELLKKMNEIYERCSLPQITARGSLGGSDAAEFTVAGIPCVDSIGVDGNFIHTPKEYAVVSSLSKAAKRIATVCAYIEG